MRMRLHIFEPFQYLHTLFLGVFDLLRKHQIFLGPIRGQSFLLAVPTLPFADEFDTIQQHGGVCTLAITIIGGGFLVLLVLAAEIFEELRYFLLDFLVAQHLAIGVDHELMQEVLNLDVLAQAEG